MPCYHSVLIEIFAGSAMIAKVFAQQGLLVSAPVDLPEYNLLDDADWKRLLAVIRKERLCS